MRRFKGADQHGTGAAGALAHEIDTPVNPVRAIDIGIARRAEHHSVACGWPAKAMRRWVGVVIGLDLDDQPADAIDSQRRTDQIGCDRMYTAVKEYLADAIGSHGRRC